MDFEKFNISKTQAIEFAQSIFADIDDYVNSHEDEYQSFLLGKQEVKNEETI